MKNISVAIFLLLATFCKGQIHFGSLVSFSDSEHTSGDITDVASQLGIKYIRHTVIMQGWDGTSTRFDQFANAGFKVILNINYGNPVLAPIPFPTDTDAYKEQLSAILDIHHAEVIVIENEEQTDDYHSGPIQDYINELAAAIEVCHSKGLKVTNGGLLTTPLCIIIYNDYISRGLITQAEDFKNRTFNQQMLYYIANPKGDSDLGIRVANCNTLLSAYAQLNLDYINFHLAEPVNFSTYGDGQSATPGVYKEMINYLSRITGKPVMTNETAQKNLSPTLVTSMLNEYKKTGIKYVIWYSGDGNIQLSDSALHNDDLTLRLNGIAFSNFMMNKSQDLTQPGLYASTISPFDTLCLYGGSAPNIFTLTGSSLDGSDITIGPLNGYSFSKSSIGGFTKTLVIGGYGSSFTQAIYIHFNSRTEGVFKGNVPVKGGGVASISLPVTGVILNTTPTLSANISNISCNNNNDGAINLVPQGGAGPFLYSWTSSTSSFRSSNEDLSGLAPAFYTVVVTAQRGCTETATYHVTQPAKLDMVISKDSNIVCKNGTTTVKVTGMGGTVPYTGIGIFTANPGNQYYTVSDANGCSKTKSIFLTNGSLSKPQAPASINGIDADKKGVCGDGNYSYSVNAVSGASFYTWKAPDGINIEPSNLEGTSATLNAASGFASGLLTVTAGNVCGISPAAEKTISAVPAKPVSISGPLVVAKNEKGLIYTVSPIVDGVTYFWSFSNGSKITDGQNTSSITVSWGAQPGKVLVRAVNNCDTSYSTSLDVALSALADKQTGSNPEQISINHPDQNFSILPNPVRATAYVIFSSGISENYIIEVTDFAGKLLQRKTGISVIGKNQINIDADRYSNGMYIVTLIRNNKERKMLKLLRQ